MTLFKRRFQRCSLNLVNVEVHGQTVGAFVDIELTNAFGSAASSSSQGVEQHEHLLRRHGPWSASDRFERFSFYNPDLRRIQGMDGRSNPRTPWC